MGRHSYLSFKVETDTESFVYEGFKPVTRLNDLDFLPGKKLFAVQDEDIIRYFIVDTTFARAMNQLDKYWEEAYGVPLPSDYRMIKIHF